MPVWIYPLLAAPALCACASFLALPAAAQSDLEFSVSPSPVGSGARAAGMANAFVAIADDATAASWNPAGLVQLERPELSVVGAYNAVVDNFHTGLHPESEGRHFTDGADINYLSFAYPLPFLILGRNATLSLNYQNRYDFDRKFGFRYRSSSLVNATISRSYSQATFAQAGKLSALSPAFGIELTQRLSAGATINFWRSSPASNNEWHQTARFQVTRWSGSQLTAASLVRHEYYEDFRGENVTMGLLWNPTDRWSLGLRYDSAFTGTVNFRVRDRLISLPILPFASKLPSVTPGRLQEDRRVRFPDSVAGGIAFRPNDRLTLSADFTRTGWNDYYVEYVRDRERIRRSLVTGTLLGKTESPDFESTSTVRVGAEYVFIPVPPKRQLNRLWSIRGGLFYDEEPATGKPDAFYGFALGAGLLIKHRLNIDAAYQFRYGDRVNRDFIRNLEGFSEDVVQHRVLMSVVLYF